MPNYTIQDLAWMKGVPVPVRETLFSLEQQLTTAQAREAELMADNARLLEALDDGFNKISQMCFEGEWTGIETTIDKIRKTLAATPEQSLARLRNKVQEEYATILDDDDANLYDSEFHAAAARLNEGAGMKARQFIIAKCYDKRGQLLSVGVNSYTKTHPLQAYFAKKVGHSERQFLHAEIHAFYRDWETDRKSTRLNSSH